MGLVANTGKEDAGSGRILGCPPAGSETSMASRLGLSVLRGQGRSFIVRRMYWKDIAREQSPWMGKVGCKILQSC